MPLLKKKSFEKTTLPEYLRDDEEVFFCELTNEIFRDYEEFSERMFLCNSMVWTCCMTGKSNLTYTEALESEENAKKSLKEFPNELKIPLLYLASKTKRSAFGEMAEDLFLYIKDRYFIGENIETCFTANKWKDSHVLQVIAPTPDQIKKSPVKNGGTSEREFQPAANLYKYEIEHLDADDEDISEIMIVDCNQMRRKKAFFSKDKCKLFLKQYVEQDDKGMFVIKPSVLEEFGMNKMSFSQIFDGPLPNFETSKKFDKVQNGQAKKSKQATLNKFLSKNNHSATLNGKENNKASGKNLLDQMKKREEEFKLKKQQREEEMRAAKLKRKEDNVKMAAYLKEWYKPKEDLELEDLKKLPDFPPVVSRVPEKHIGDMLMVLEFVNSFSKLLSMKDFFPAGFNMEVMERALMEKEVAGPLTDLIQMLLSALFNVQDEEASQYRTQIEQTRDIKEEDVPENLSLHEATRLATLASSWSNKYLGLPIGRLPLYSLTVSEILRLHLLSSGARINETGAKWRYAQRGGYTSEDDPGLYLRLHQPHILKALAIHNVVQLPITDKLKIISCLINQLLTYADVRDVIDERMEKNKQSKADLRNLQLAERKREAEYIAQKYKLKREKKDEPSVLTEEVDKLDKEADKKKAENERKIEKTIKATYENQTFLGLDRAFRKYMALDSVPGIFVDCEDRNAGVCLPEPVEQFPRLAEADKTEILEHVKKIYEELNSSDKENEPNQQQPKQSSVVSKTFDPKEYHELMACSSDPKNCIVHSTTYKIAQQRWCFLKSKEQFKELIESLNKRGTREGELHQVLSTNEQGFASLISQTPVASLNPSVVEETDETRPQISRTITRKLGKSKYEDANLGFPLDMPPEEVLHNALIDNILEMEEKIYAGNLGTLQVKDREAWRNCLANKNYADLDKTVVKRENGKLSKVVKEDKGSRPNTPDVSNELKDYQDPGRFLGATVDISSEDSDTPDDDIVLVHSSELNTSIHSLAVALAQVAQAVEPKYLKKPLGHAEISKTDRKKPDEFDVINKWEQSLLASTSFSKVFLHYGTLDSCVMWSRSALLARCRICRRQKDSENMLLCDSCNLGHHLYCLKPKLTSVPKGDWFCNKCLKEREEQEKLKSPEATPQKKRRIFRDEDVEDEEESDHDDQMEVDSDGECILEEQDDESIVDESKLCKACGSGGETLSCERCCTCYHWECVRPPIRRAPRLHWLCTACKNKYKDDDSSESNGENEVVKSSRRSHRREEGREDLPLHNAALQELLIDIMKQEDAWPFLRPVQKNEVPDYYDVISKPMDFGTIKYKLNMGEYSHDGQFMHDSVLIFENCNTYNQTYDEVYKCGVRLLRHFIKRSKELGLKLPEEMEGEAEGFAPKVKKRRTK